MRVFEWKRRYAAGAAMVLVAAGLLTGCGQQKAAAPRLMSIPVVTATAMQKDVPIQITAIGAVESPIGVQVKSMLNGEITSVGFKEGQDVKKGDRLFTIDRRPTEADLRRNEATLARDMATAANARADARRYQALWKEGVVADQQAEQMQTAADAADALVEADRAAVINSKVQLTYTDILSPISGRTGTLSIQLGNVIKANDTPFLVTINQIKPIYVTFTLPERYLSEVKRYMAGNRLAVTASIPNDPQPAEGTLTFVDNAVDRQTGTIKLKGTFVNADTRLWPGQYVNVTLTLGRQPDAVVVPLAALQNGQQGQFLFVIRKDMTAESRPVVVARTVGGEAVVQSGVAPGETVVVDGQSRLTSGSKVEIKSGVPGEHEGQNAESRGQGQTS
jgi:multidrug efflux system membrane fusion protein